MQASIDRDQSVGCKRSAAECEEWVENVAEESMLSRGQTTATTKQVLKTATGTVLYLMGNVRDDLVGIFWFASRMEKSFTSNPGCRSPIAAEAMLRRRVFTMSIATAHVSR